MKILFCTNAFENIVNGPAKFANLILEINHRYPKHEIRILTEDISEAALEKSKYVYKVNLGIPSLLKPLGQVLRMFIYYKRATQIRKDYDYDLLVYINAFNGLWASMVSPRPTVGMINDEKNIIASLTNASMNRLWFKKFVFKNFEKLSTRYHKLIISNSDYLTQRLINAYQLPQAKVKRLYKSINLADAAFNPDRCFDSPIKILFVKADYMVGGLDVLAQALGQLKQYNFVITVIGPEKRFESHLMSLFKDTTNVEVDYIGPQPQKVVYEYLKTYDIFSVPSYTEALGVANIEALAFGISVISTKVGGIPEVLDYGNNGWLVSPHKPDELANAIKDCIEHADKRLQKSNNGRLFIKKFSKDEMLHAFVQILESTCS